MRWSEPSPAQEPGQAAGGSGTAGSRAAALLRLIVRWLKEAWPVLRFVVGLGLAALALWALAGQRGELDQVGTLLVDLHWSWTVPAATLEVLSFCSFALMQDRLLRAGRVRPPFRSLLAMTLGAQSVNNSLPAGAAFSAVYGFRWYRRFGADDALAAWTLVGTMVGAAVSLALVAAGGVALATSLGANLDLVGVVIGVLVVTLAAGALLVYERPLVVATSWTIRGAKRVTGRPRGDVERLVRRVVSWITVVRLSWRDVTAIAWWGLANWLFDCGTFALCFLAVGARIPWGGLLLAYGAGQLAANLPITPGGLGAVEGSITIALVAFGGPRTSTVAAVLLYRIISFWLQIPVGWLCAAGLAAGVRKDRWLATPGSVAAVPSVPAAPPISDPVPAAGGEVDWPGYQGADQGEDGGEINEGEAVARELRPDAAPDGWGLGA